VEQYSKWYCYSCKKYVEAPPATGAVQLPTSSPIWYQNAYTIKKKVLTVWNKYWIQDQRGKNLGFSKQKMFKLKEDIRVYTDEKMKEELFKIKQQQILDLWATFAVVDTKTDATLGFIKRKALKSGLVRDEWEAYNAQNQLIGGIYEKTGRGLARKYMPGGKLIPQKMTFELNNAPVAKIDQKFKVIGDIWNLTCTGLPQDFDRRVLLGSMLLMGMIERKRK
jgi:uncharacterized protein YxjI